jgi:hypothetical protein
MSDYDYADDQAGIWRIAGKATLIWVLTWCFLFMIFPIIGNRVGSIITAFLTAPFYATAAYYLTLFIYSSQKQSAVFRYVSHLRDLVGEKIKARKQELLAGQTGKQFDGLTLGYSTGLLDGRGCPVGVPRDQKIHLPPENCCQNIFIMGGIGSGKTAAIINPLLLQILKSDASALVFDIKGDFFRELSAIAKLASREYKTIGLAEDALTVNLFRGCSPELASSYLRSCFVAKGAASGDSSFWVDSACDYCRNFLYLLQLADGDYSIAGLATAAFSERRKNELIDTCLGKSERGELGGTQKPLWDNTFDYFTETVSKWDDKLRANIFATLQTVLNPFVHPDFVRAFSSRAEKEVDFDDLLNGPTIFFVQLPSSMGDGARWAYLIIKLRFFDLMRSRRSRSNVNQERYVAYFCDEYQKIVDSVSDTDFWDKSRSSKCFGVVSMQGYASMILSVGGQQAADAISQNWRQKIMLLSEDEKSIEKMQRLIGKGDAQIHSHSRSESKNTSESGHGGGSSGSSRSESHSVSVQRREFFDHADVRALFRGQALYVGTVGHQAMADTIDVIALPIAD